MVTVTPLRIHELPIDAETHVIASEVVPEKSGGRIVNVGLIVVEREFVGHLTLKIVGALLAAIGDLPGLLVVVGRDCGGRPYVAVTGHFAAVVEIVEHAKLTSELVLVGRDVFAEKGKRGIANSNLEIAEDLV